MHLQFVQSYEVDGKRYCYFRRGKFRARLTAKPGSAEFLREYADALARSTDQPAPEPARRVQPKTVAALIDAYRRSQERRDLRQTSRITFDRVVAAIERDHGGSRST